MRQGQGKHLDKVMRSLSARRKDVKEYTGKKIGKREEKEVFRTKNIVSSNTEMPATKIRERRTMKPEDFKICSMFSTGLY